MSQRELNLVEVPSIFETDEDGEATGTVHFYCSDDCRRQNDLPVTERTVYGASPIHALCDGTVCETCGKPIDS